MQGFPEEISDNFFQQVLTVEIVEKIKSKTNNFETIKKLAFCWHKQLSDKDKEKLDIRSPKATNTFSERIIGQEEYVWDVSLFDNIAFHIQKTAKAIKTRNPAYLVIPEHPGMGKTRTLEEIIKLVMENGLQEKLNLENWELIEEQKMMKDSLGLMITFNDVLTNHVTNHATGDLSSLFERYQTKIDEIDLMSRIAFW